MDAQSANSTTGADRVIRRCPCGAAITAVYVHGHIRYAEQAGHGYTRAAYRCPTCGVEHSALINPEGHLLSDDEIGQPLTTALIVLETAERHIESYRQAVRS